MKSEDLFLAFGEIDEEYLEESERYRKRKPRSGRWWFGLAACICVAAVGAGSFFYQSAQNLSTSASSKLTAFDTTETEEFSAAEAVPAPGETVIDAALQDALDTSEDNDTFYILFAFYDSSGNLLTEEDTQKELQSLASQGYDIVTAVYTDPNTAENIKVSVGRLDAGQIRSFSSPEQIGTSLSLLTDSTGAIPELEEIVPFS